MDAIDTALLAQLRVDGRARQQTLAGALGISRSAVAARMHTLFGTGAVQTVSVVHPSVMGLHAVAHLSIRVERPVDEVAALLAAHDDTPFVSLVSGSADLVAEIRTPGQPELAAALERVRSTAGVTAMTTLLCATLEVDVLRPAAGSERDVDDVDRVLLELLLDDGRMSLSELSRRSGLSTGTVRVRTRRLFDNDIIKVGVVATAAVEQAGPAIGVGVQIRGPVRPVVDAVAAHPATRFLATTAGRFDLLATLHAASMAEGAELLDRIRRLPAVVAIESWVHLQVVKERYRLAPMTDRTTSAVPDPERTTR